MFAEEIRRQAESAPRAALPAVSAALWKAFSAGAVSEAEAEQLSWLIEARMALAAAQAPAAGQAAGAAQPRQDGVQQLGAALPRRTGSRPRTDASMERRRRWAASGRLPPQLASQFTLAEQAVLAVVAVEAVKRGDCRLFHEHIAALAGVSRSTVRATLRRARDLGIVAIEERRSSAWRNLSSIVRIASREWTAWNRLVRRSAGQGGGAISPTTTNTKVLDLPSNRTAETARRAAGGQGRGRKAGPQDSSAPARSGVRAMR